MGNLLTTNLLENGEMENKKFNSTAVHASPDD